MDQAALEKRLAEIFGSKAGQTKHQQTTVDIDNPAFVPPGQPGFNPTINPKLSVTEETWTDADGNALKIQRWPDGTVHETGAATAPGKTALTPAEQETATLTAQKQKNAALPKDQDPRYEDDATRAARADATIKQQGADAIAAEARARQAKIDEQDAANTAADNKRADEAAAQAAATRNRPTVTIKDDGQGGLVSISTDPNTGKSTTSPVPGVRGTPQQVTVGGVIYERGPDGKYAPAAGLPTVGPDNPSVAGPEMPTIVLGASQQALQTYKQKLQEGVAAKQWSQKWANDRWAEATQVAATAVQEATTQQARDASALNANINLAQGRATLGQNAITTALDYVNKINGSLPEGSALGGQTFAALLGISMLMQARSGVDTINTSGKKPAPVPQITAADMTSQGAIAAKRAEIQAHPVFAPKSPATYPGSSQATVTSGAAPVAPGGPVAATGAPAPAPPPAPAALPPQAQGPNPAINQATGEPTGLAPLPDSRVVPAQPYDPTTNPGAPEPGMTPAATTSAPSSPSPTPDYGQHGMTILPQPAASGNEQADDWLTVRNKTDGSTVMVRRSEWDQATPEYQAQFEVDNAQNGANITPTPMPYNEPTAPTPGLPLGQSRTGSEYPVLASYGPSSAPAQPVTSAPSVPSYPVLDQYQPPVAPMAVQGPPPVHPAILASKARATAPWNLSPDEIAQMQAAGISDQDIWSVPGRAA